MQKDPTTLLDVKCLFLCTLFAFLFNLVDLVVLFAEAALDTEKEIYEG